MVGLLRCSAITSLKELTHANVIITYNTVQAYRVIIMSVYIINHSNALGPKRPQKEQSIRSIHPLQPSNSLLQPYSNRVSCGFPSPAQDHAEAPISLDELLDIQAPHIYIVRAAGDSMIGAGIYDNDWLIVDRALSAQHGHIIIAALHGEPLVRRLHHPEQPHPQLVAANPAYDPTTIRPQDDFFIWGVVCHSIRRHSPR